MSARTRIALADKQRKLVDQWNAQHPAGTAVTVRKDDGSEIQTKTRSEAAMLGGHTAVIWLDGMSGCYLLERVTLLAPGPCPLAPVSGGVA